MWEGESMRPPSPFPPKVSFVSTTPIILVSWGRGAANCQYAARAAADRAFFKAGRYSDYKSLPVPESATSFAVVALLSPLDGRRYAFAIHLPLLRRVRVCAIITLFRPFYGDPRAHFRHTVGALLRGLRRADSGLPGLRGDEDLTLHALFLMGGFGN